jgi:membrane protease YdiL (CAAX protease family)
MPFPLIFVALAVVVTGIAGALAFDPSRGGTVTFWAIEGVPTIAMAVAAGYWAKREELLRTWLTPRWGDFTRGVVGALVLFASAWGFVHWLAPVGSSREIWLVTLYGQIGDPRVLQSHGAQVGGAIMVLAVAEEVLWRGLVTTVIADRVGTRTAWIWAAGLYALAQVPTMWPLRATTGVGSLDPILPIAALGAGLVLGAMAKAFGRLGPGIVAHAFFDWAVVMMLPLWGSR